MSRIYKLSFADLKVGLHRFESKQNWMCINRNQNQSRPWHEAHHAIYKIMYCITSAFLLCAITIRLPLEVKYCIKPSLTNKQPQIMYFSLTKQLNKGPGIRVRSAVKIFKMFECVAQNHLSYEEDFTTLLIHLRVQLSVEGNQWNNLQNDSIAHEKYSHLLCAFFMILKYKIHTFDWLRKKSWILNSCW